MKIQRCIEIAAVIEKLDRSHSEIRVESVVEGLQTVIKDYYKGGEVQKAEREWIGRIISVAKSMNLSMYSWYKT